MQKGVGAKDFPLFFATPYSFAKIANYAVPWSAWGTISTDWFAQTFAHCHRWIFTREGEGGFVKIFQQNFVTPESLTAIFGERFAKLRGENWQISPQKLRSNSRQFANY
jgi:hypothetical protein